MLAPRPCRRRSCSRLRSNLAPRCSLTLHHGQCSAIDTVHDGVRATAGFSDLLRGDWVLIPQVPASAGRAFDRHPPPAPPLAQLDVFLHRALQIVAVSRPGQALSLRIESCASQQPRHCSSCCAVVAKSSRKLELPSRCYEAQSNLRSCFALRSC